MSNRRLISREYVQYLSVGQETPFLVLDLQVAEQQYKRLNNALQGVTLFYAIKALSHSRLIHSLNCAGSCFDLASPGEVRIARDAGVTGDRCIQSNPVKKDKDIRSALEFGCNRFVVDNLTELKKFATYKDRVEIIIRIAFQNDDALIDLSSKFGCDDYEVNRIIGYATEKGITISGLSFHAGSQSFTPKAHVKAISHCIYLMEKAWDVDWKWLDIGGGFPVEYSSPVMQIDEFCKPINEAIGFLPKNIEVFAEPGRFIAAPAMIEVLTVIGKAQRNGKTWYYLDDGVYGAFSGKLFDRANYKVKPLKTLPPGVKLFPSVLAGPTCDSIDVIDSEASLPELYIGDLMVAQKMGAYTLSSATEFNGYPKPYVLTLTP